MDLTVEWWIHFLGCCGSNQLGFPYKDIIWNDTYSRGKAVSQKFPYICSGTSGDVIPLLHFYCIHSMTSSCIGYSIGVTQGHTYKEPICTSTVHTHTHTQYIPLLPLSSTDGVLCWVWGAAGLLSSLRVHGCWQSQAKLQLLILYCCKVATQTGTEVVMISRNYFSYY